MRPDVLSGLAFLSVVHSLALKPEFATQDFTCLINALNGHCFRVPKAKGKETLALTSLRSRAILGLLDILVDIGVPAEKEVIQ